MPQKRPLRILAGGLIAGAIVLLFAAKLQHKMRDFEVYWTAGQRAVAAEPLYRESDEHYQFKYLPAFALLAAPLGLLPLALAKALWFGLSMGLLFLLLYVSARDVPQPALPRGWLIAATLVTMGKFYAHELVLGQANLLFAVTAIVTLAALLRSREIPAGFAAGLAFAVKPYAALFIPYLLLIGHVRAAAVAVTTATVVILAPVARYGVAGTLQLYADWWRIVPDSTRGTLTNPDSVSVAAMFAKWFGWGAGAGIASGIAIVLLAAALLIVLAKRRGVRAPEYLEMGLLLTLIPLITPQGWDYVLLLSTPLIMALVGVMPRVGRGDRVAFIVASGIVAFSLYDLMGRAAYAAFMSWSVITVCYLAIIAVAVRVRVQQLL